jgi:hypothetical protein
VTQANLRQLGTTLAALLGLAACKATTTRPYYPPLTGAAQTEIELGVRETTQALADVLRGDSLPVTRVEPRDGFVETAWFDVRSRRPAGGRHLGPEVVQVRAWADPSRPGHSRLVVETVFRPLADPSLSSRALDRQVPPDHPIAKRMTEILTQLAKLYSTEPAEQAPDAGLPARP